MHRPILEASGHKALIFPTEAGTHDSHGIEPRSTATSHRMVVAHGRRLRHREGSQHLRRAEDGRAAKHSITLDVYGDLWKGSGERLAARLDEALRDTWAPALRVMGSITAELAR